MHLRYAQERYDDAIGRRSAAARECEAKERVQLLLEQGAAESKKNETRRNARAASKRARVARAKAKVASSNLEAFGEDFQRASIERNRRYEALLPLIKTAQEAVPAADHTLRAVWDGRPKGWGVGLVKELTGLDALARITAGYMFALHRQECERIMQRLGETKRDLRSVVAMASAEEHGASSEESGARISLTASVHKPDGWTKKELCEKGAIGGTAFDAIRKAARVPGALRGVHSHRFEIWAVEKMVAVAKERPFTKKGRTAAAAWQKMIDDTYAPDDLAQLKAEMAEEQ